MGLAGSTLAEGRNVVWEVSVSLAKDRSGRWVWDVNLRNWDEVVALFIFH